MNCMISIHPDCKYRLLGCKQILIPKFQKFPPGGNIYKYLRTVSIKTHHLGENIFNKMRNLYIND